MRIRTLLAGALAALLVGLTASSAQAYVGSPTYQKQILDRTNVVRAGSDRTAVAVRACLDTYANSWAKYLATRKKSLQHRPSWQLRKIMSRCNLDGIGENLAFGYSTGSATVNAWVRSPGHHANQLGAKYRQIGIGAYRDSKNRYYAVTLYGNPR